MRYRRAGTGRGGRCSFAGEILEHGDIPFGRSGKRATERGIFGNFRLGQKRGFLWANVEDVFFQVDTAFMTPEHVQPQEHVDALVFHNSE